MRIPFASLMSTCLLSCFAACSSSEDTATPPLASGGSGGGQAGAASAGGKSGAGQAGSAQGGKAGQAAAGGTAGGSGSAGASGSAAASGASGKAGMAGQAGAAAGQAGSAGNAAGQAGNAAGKAGSAGTAGAGGAACKVDGDCKGALPTVAPVGCAKFKCDVGQCRVVAVDADGDGYPTSKCIANDGTPIAVGTDCDDTLKTINPGEWDGPAGGGKPDRCDSIDEDCSGTPDDKKQPDGTSCSCSPGDVQSCATDAAGKPIVFPKVDGLGKPYGACKLGSRQCLPNGTFGPCVGAIGPEIEKCNQKDDDCNELIDDAATDRVEWVYDGDGDQHAGVPENGYASVLSCPGVVPVDPPTACTKYAVPCALGATADACCPKSAWKPASTINSDDCDDRDKKIGPTQPEACGNGKDDNCNGSIDEQCICTGGQSYACSEKTTGAPITWPGGTPKGTCQYGQKLCNDDGKSYGACIGAISPAPADACTVGNDDSCNGIPREGCACVPTTTQDCGVAIGSCKMGKQTCKGDGTWDTSCVGAIEPKASDSCAPGNDDNCNGIPNEGCACVDGVYPCGSAATCNDGATQTCANGVMGACSVVPVLNVGGDCSVQGSLIGACALGGTVECAGSGGQTNCKKKDPSIGNSSIFHDAVFPWPKNKFDWDCDGIVTRRFQVGSYTQTPDCQPTGQLKVNAEALCNSITGQVECTDLGQGRLTGSKYADLFLFCSATDPPNCGDQGTMFSCYWDDATSACLFSPFVFPQKQQCN